MLRRSLLAFPLFAIACVTPGDRTNGRCPAGETCSPDTPNGLGFMGSPIQGVSGGVQSVALNGSERIRALSGIAVTSPPFALPFDAAVSTNALTVSATNPPDTTIHGAAEGSAYLRLVAPGTNLLYDRTQIDVKAIGHSYLRASDYASVASDQQYATDNRIGWAMLAGGTDVVAVSLFASDGTRLTDESTQLGASASFSYVAHTAWDLITVHAGSGANGIVTVRTGDGVTRDAVLPIAAVVTDVANVPAIGAALAAQGIAVNATTTLCFRALSGTDLVAGVTWSWSVTGGVTTAVPLLNGKNCIAVRSTTVGSATLTVTASNASRDFPLQFVPARGVSEAPRALEAADATPGDRALDAMEED